MESSWFKRETIAIQAIIPERLPIYNQIWISTQPVIPHPTNRQCHYTERKVNAFQTSALEKWSILLTLNPFTKL